MCCAVLRDGGPIVKPPHQDPLHCAPGYTRPRRASAHPNTSEAHLNCQTAGSQGSPATSLHSEHRRCPTVPDVCTLAPSPQMVRRCWSLDMGSHCNSSPSHCVSHALRSAAFHGRSPVSQTLTQPLPFPLTQGSKAPLPSGVRCFSNPGFGPMADAAYFPLPQLLTPMCALL